MVGGKGAIDDGSLPQKYVIDYVRVYQSAQTPPSASAVRKAGGTRALRPG